MKNLLSLFILVLFPAITFAQAPTLIGSWQFNGNANDGSGNGLNGIVYGAVLTAGQSGAPNTAYQFNGSSAHIDVPFNALLNLTTWTIQTVVKIDSFNSNTCQEEDIVSRGTAYGNDYIGLVLNDNTHDHSCTVSSPNFNEFLSAAAGPAGSSYHDANYIQLHTWYCVTSTYNGSWVKIYVNGILVDSSSYAGPYDTTTTTPPLIFGYYPAGGSSYPYWLNGVIDNVSIWKGVLSDSAISNICGEHDSCSLQCYWRVTGNNSITSTDFLGTTNAEPIIIKTNNTQRAVIQGSGNGNIGIANTTPTTTLDVNAVAPKGVPSGLRLEQLPTGNGSILVVDGAGYVYKTTAQAALAQTKDNEFTKLQDQMTQMQQRINILEASIAANNLTNGSSLSLSPNPTTGQVTAVYTISGSPSYAEISITDNMGKTILTQAVVGNSGSVIVHIPSNVASSQLLCTLFADGKVMASQKLVLLNK